MPKLTPEQIAEMSSDDLRKMILDLSKDDPEKDDQKDDKKNENMIPQSRFNQVLDERKKLEADLEKIKKQQKEDLEKQLEDNERWKELAEQRGTERDQALEQAKSIEDYEGILKDVLSAQLEDIPENMRKLVPAVLSVKDQLSWIAENKSILVKPKSPDFDAGKKGGGKPQDNGKVDLSPEELAVAKRSGLTPEEYAKYR